ncbi:hypothetical protein DSO57_1004555 [Entomophthora muscae]|uniref:Uncharacterized protein n=1 Tax=Entomophthora muscae TaxID=34485 RepID=A0ACC2SAC0_9FUNG|nr:hypothetical protein DSO57_1004555 [Entomophthora muscae]
MKFQAVLTCYLFARSLANPGLPFSGLIEGVGELFSPEILKQLPNLVSLDPPLKLNVSRRWLHDSPKTVRDYLSRSLISVCSHAKSLSFECLCNEKYSDIHAIDDPYLQATVLVAVHKPDRQIVVSYRPATKLENWLTNLNYDWVPFRRGHVHQGFFNHFKATQKRSEAVVIHLLEKYTHHSLLVTGYSLGGATALIAVPYFKEILDAHEDRRHFSAILYASPRVGDAEFVSMIYHLKVPVTRYSNHNDIISHIPPRSFGYTHAGVEVHEYSTSSGTSKLRICSQSFDEDPTCAWHSVPFLSAARHIAPLGKPIPVPQFC